MMMTTLDLPKELVGQAMAATHISTENDVVKYALESVVQKERVKGLVDYFGKVNLDINLDELRKR
jgi:hypothetical protein